MGKTLYFTQSLSRRSVPFLKRPKDGVRGTLKFHLTHKCNELEGQTKISKIKHNKKICNSTKV